MRREWALVLPTLLACNTAHATAPRVAPGVFATNNYALTFRIPFKASYCPLPEDFFGSDHGTILFLQPPRACGGAGYPSIARDFEPAQTPNISVYYALRSDDDDAPSRPPPCNLITRLRFLGRMQPVCLESRAPLVASVAGRYIADGDAEAIVTLSTTRRRFRRDFAAFKALAATVRSCTVKWRVGKASGTSGTGARCPNTGGAF